MFIHNILIIIIKIINILKNYFAYNNVKLYIQIHRYNCEEIIRELYYIITTINFKEKFKFINILLKIVDILNYFINILTYLKNYDIINTFDYLIFYFKYIFNRYYYNYNDFIFIYNCIYSLNYFDLCCKYFTNINDEELSSETHIFTYIFYLTFFGMIFPQLYYPVLKFLLERYNTMSNIPSYYICVSLPI